MICKFVLKNGEPFGESIDIYGDYLIVKVESEFLAIPKKCIEKVENENILITDFNEEKAREMGKKWVEEKSKPVSIDELRSYGFEDESGS